MTVIELAQRADLAASNAFIRAASPSRNRRLPQRRPSATRHADQEMSLLQAKMHGSIRLPAAPETLRLLPRWPVRSVGMTETFSQLDGMEWFRVWDCGLPAAPHFKSHDPQLLLEVRRQLSQGFGSPYP